MGWLNTVLDVASVGLEISQLGKLEDLRRQGATAALVQAVLQELRNQIFNYKQAAQTILDTESKDRKIAAGAMRVLEMRLQDSGITADLFLDLNDKEYVASTYRLIRDNSNRLREQLPSTDRSEIEGLAEAAHRLPEYNYYDENYTEYTRFLEAKETLEKLEIFTKPIVSNGIGGITIILGLVIMGIISFLFPQLLFIGIIIGGASAIGVGFWAGGYVRKAKNTKKLIGELDQKLDIERIARLDKEFGGDPGKTAKLQSECRAQIERFFGNSPLLPL